VRCAASVQYSMAAEIPDGTESPSLAGERRSSDMFGCPKRIRSYLPASSIKTDAGGYVRALPEQAQYARKK
jgi:hypothetical protein